MELFDLKGKPSCCVELQLCLEQPGPVEIGMSKILLLFQVFMKPCLSQLLLSPTGGSGLTAEQPELCLLM